MLGIPMRYLLKHPASGVADLLADPIETWTTIRESSWRSASCADLNVRMGLTRAGKSGFMKSLV